MVPLQSIIEIFKSWVLKCTINKTINNLTPLSMKEIFPDRMYKGPNIRSQTDFEITHVNSVKG